MATNTEVNVRINVDAKGADTSVGSIKKQLKDATNELIAMREKFGESSQEAVNAAKRVATLKDSIGDAKNMADAFNPDAKFKALGSAIQAVAGGFAAVQGAQALFGAESEDVAKVLAKVQGAMALTQGINSILEAKDSFKNLKVVAVDAFKAIKGAIGTTGIGLLVVALGTLVAYWDDIAAAISRTSDKQKALNETFDEYKKAATESTKTTMDVKTAFDLAKQGVISKESALKKYNETLGGALGTAKDLNEAERIFRDKTDAYIKATGLRAQADALLKKAAEEQVSLVETNAKKKELAEKVANENSFESTLAYFNGVDDLQKGQLIVDEQNSKKKVDLYQTTAEDLLKQAAVLEKDNKIKNAEQIKSEKETADAINKTLDTALQKATQKQEQLLANQQRINEERKKNSESFASESQKLEDELLLLSIKNEDERAKKKLAIDLENRKKAIQETNATEESKNKLLIELKLKYEADIKAIDDAAETKRKEEADAKRQKAIDYENETFAILEQNRISNIKDVNEKAFAQESLRYQNEIDAALESLNKKEIDEVEYQKRREALELIHQTNLTGIETTAAEERAKKTEAERQAKIAQYQEIGSLANELSNIIGQNTAVGKALALSQIAIDTGVAISALTRNSEANPANAPTGGIAGAIQFASGLIRILANIKKAKDLLSQAKVPARGGAGGGNTSVSIPATAPLPPTLSTTMLNQGQINQLSSATARAFVLESDVSGNQERIQRLNRAARIS